MFQKKYKAHFVRGHFGRRFPVGTFWSLRDQGLSLPLRHRLDWPMWLSKNTGIQFNHAGAQEMRRARRVRSRALGSMRRSGERRRESGWLPSHRPITRWAASTCASLGPIPSRASRPDSV